MQRLYLIIFSSIAVSFFVFETGCKKEYSYEGGLPAELIEQPDSITVVDSSINNSAPIVPACAACEGIDTTASFWMFNVGAASFCGTVTNTVISGDKTAMTFFGPSSCFPDSGLIITAFFSEGELNTNTDNLKAARSSLQYYDNSTGVDAFVSEASSPFKLMIDNYDPQTGMAMGRFGGNVRGKDGNVITIDAGRFRIKF